MRRQIKSTYRQVSAIGKSHFCKTDYSTKDFTSAVILSYFNNAPVKKAGASREKLNTYKAYDDTPSNACFFMRELRTPKENDRSNFGLVVLLSMMACNGQPLAVGCFPCKAVSHPVTRYRPSREKQSDSLNITRTIKMIYQFAGVSRHTYNPTQLKQFRVLAQSETQARALLARNYVLVLIGRLPNTAKNQNTIILGGAK